MPKVIRSLTSVSCVLLLIAGGCSDDGDNDDAATSATSGPSATSTTSGGGAVGGSGAAGGSGGMASGGEGGSAGGSGGSTGGSGGAGGTGGAGGMGGGGGSGCVGSSTIVINEVLYDPNGSNDAANEWIELYNGSGAAVDVSGWKIETGTSTYSLKFTFPAATTLAMGEYVTIGGNASTNTDHQAAVALNMGNNSGGSCDALRLLTDGDVVVDTVIYGDNNDNGWLDDCGNVATNFVAAGFSGDTIARSPNGSDTNDQLASDFVRRSDAAITMGAANP